MKVKRVYLDNASTTPVRSEVLHAMLPYFSDEFGNPANLYGMGRNARVAVDEARRKIAAALNCLPDEFVFTGSATEADNLAIAGVARAAKIGIGGKVGARGRIIVSSVEHKGILAIADEMKKEGFEVVLLPVGKNGLIDLEALKKSLNDRTVLVSVTMADSETGTLQPIREIAGIIRKWRVLSVSQFPYFHTDASQAAAYADVNLQKIGVDLMTISAHKLGGPKGIGGLFVRKGVKVQPIIFGGGQQGKIRSGTENVPAIVGFGEVIELTRNNFKVESARIAKLRDRLESGILKSIPKVVLNGHRSKRLPNFLNISILDVEGEALLLHLDEVGIMVNTGSACNSESLTPSYVLTALGNPYEFVHGSIRFTLGHMNTAKDIDHVLKHLPGIVEKLRKISPLNLSLDQKENISDKRAFINNQTPHFLRKKK